MELVYLSVRTITEKLLFLCVLFHNKIQESPQVTFLRSSHNFYSSYDYSPIIVVIKHTLSQYRSTTLRKNWNQSQRKKKNDLKSEFHQGSQHEKDAANGTQRFHSLSLVHSARLNKQSENEREKNKNASFLCFIFSPFLVSLSLSSLLHSTFYPPL